MISLRWGGRWFCGASRSIGRASPRTTLAMAQHAGKPFAVALTMMLVIALIGLVLAVLIPRQPIEATATPSPGPEPATWQPAP